MDSESRPQDSVAVVLYGLLKNIDTEPSNAWIFEDLGDGECYLQKYLDRLRELPWVHCVYIATLEGKSHSKFERFGDEFVKLVYMKASDFRWPEFWWGQTWNLGAMSDSMIPVWAYQIMLGFNEDILVEDLPFGGLWDPDVVLEGLAQIRKEPEKYCTVKGVFSQECMITTRQYYQRVYKDKLLDQPKDNDSDKDSPGIRLYSNRSGQKYNFEYDRIFNIQPRLKEGYQFFRKFYSKHRESQSQKDFRREIESYCNEHYEDLFNKLPATIRINFDESQGQMRLDFLEKVLREASAISRFTVVLSKELGGYQDLQTVLSILDKYNLHYYFETDGEFDSTHLARVLDTMDVVCFDVDSPDVATFKQSSPDRKVELCLFNLHESMRTNNSRGYPQIGVQCKLPEDDSLKYQIIKFWREHMDHVAPLNFAYKMQGHLSPRIQFVRYLSPSGIEEKIEKDIDFRQLVISAPGVYEENGTSVDEIEMLDYLKLADWY